MTGRSYEQMIRKEARRFPIVAELLSRVMTLTDEEIASAQVPLPWFRIALKQMREAEKWKVNLASMENDMNAGSAFRHGSNPSIKGKQAIYRGPEIWIKMFESDMLLKTGTSVFFPFTGGIWIDCSYGPHADIRTIAMHSPAARDMTLDEYKSEFNRAQLALHPDAPLLFDPHNGSRSGSAETGRLAALGVRFS